MKFDAVVANPPYMGGKGMNGVLKEYAKVTFPDSKSDLFAMFIERGFSWCKPTGLNSMVTMQSWMFLSSYEAMRERLLRERTLWYETSRATETCFVNAAEIVVAFAAGVETSVSAGVPVCGAIGFGGQGKAAPPSSQAKQIAAAPWRAAHSARKAPPRERHIPLRSLPFVLCVPFPFPRCSSAAAPSSRIPFFLRDRVFIAKHHSFHV